MGCQRKYSEVNDSQTREIWIDGSIPVALVAGDEPDEPKDCERLRRVLARLGIPGPLSPWDPQLTNYELRLDRHRCNPCFPCPSTRDPGITLKHHETSPNLRHPKFDPSSPQPSLTETLLMSWIARESRTFCFVEGIMISFLSAYEQIRKRKVGHNLRFVWKLSWLFRTKYGRC